MSARQPVVFPIPSRAPVHTCSSCGAPVVFITTAKGKWMPLSLNKAKSNVLGERVAPSHFSDCPNAAQHRKSKR